MNKYRSLGDILSKQQEVAVSLNFKEIEQILGFTLPPSSHKHRAWWANNKSHPQAYSWMGAGWEVSKVSLETETVSWKRPTTLLFERKFVDGEKLSLQASINSKGMYFIISNDEETASSSSFSWRRIFQMLLATNPEMFGNLRTEPDHFVFLDSLNKLGYSLVDR